MSQTPSPDSLASLKAMLRRAPLLRKAGIAVAGPQALRMAAGRKGLTVRLHGEQIDIRRGADTVRVGRHHLLYAFDVVAEFDYYFDAVHPVPHRGLTLVDYSRASWHEVKDYDRHPVFFPSFSEPFVTTRQYLDFGQLQPGHNAIDLGAYSGFSSLVFKDHVGTSGTVIAVDADRQNLEAVRRNAALYQSITGRSIEILFGAVWRDNAGLSFSTEGNMGSSAAAIVGSGRGEMVSVPSFTLSTIAERHGLASVDFIKADIEGGEAFIFEDAAFFQRHRPRIIVEPHMVEGRMSSEKVRADLGRFGYSCEEVPQLGSATPLLQCTPPA